MICQRQWRLFKENQKLQENQKGSLLENINLITVDVVGFYPSIPHKARPKPLEKALQNRIDKKIDKLVKMAQLVFKIDFPV